MSAAFTVMKDHSTDEKHPTGAVVVNGGQIVARSANRSALKNRYLIGLHKRGWCIRKWLGIPTGTHYWLCPGCASNRYHSEYSVCQKSINEKLNVAGADLYLYGHWWCCKPCWDKMIEVGIRDVYLLDRSLELFKK